MHLSLCSRPDISFAVSYLSRFLDKPSNQLRNAVKRVLRDLKVTQDLKVVYKKTQDGSLHAYSDADWARDSTEKVFQELLSTFVVTWPVKKGKCGGPEYSRI
ncbi:hypothetical protein PR048_021518 [Dryococelus australis]|uniref:Uncharacterized protein n=1 Tax=Dryococelus australis TaxID=614101 RepID=A0ABQ9GYE8_9NEOP|nr:hypothetical protein PR048_021518 [Dryococelus australis]